MKNLSLNNGQKCVQKARREKMKLLFHLFPFFDDYR